MRSNQVVFSFQDRFFGPLKSRLAQASRPGNSLRDVSDLLEPFALARSVAEGADHVCAEFRSIMSRATLEKIDVYMESTTGGAKAIAPHWKNVHDSLTDIGSTSLFRRLTSTEADIGKEVGGWIGAPGASSVVGGIVGRLLGATAGIVIEQAKLGLDIASLDKKYSDWINGIRLRFHSSVMPSFASDVQGGR